MEKFKAKSSGLTMIDHTDNVNRVCKELLNISFIDGELNKFDLNVKTMLSKCIDYASKLHDIGKLTSNFQNILNDQDDENDDGKYYLHNEIGWAFFRRYFIGDNIILEYVSKLIYWHHGIPQMRTIGGDTISDILNTISENDLNVMIDWVKINKLDELFDFTDDSIDCKTPLYLEADKSKYNNSSINRMVYNPILLTMISIINSGDRIASEFETLVSNEEILKSIKKYLYYDQSKLGDVKLTENFDKSRFEKQKDIACSISGSTIIKAPAGFGKTMIGLLSFLNQNKRCLWITPRNDVADSVYNNVCNNLNDIDQKNVSVELYLSGEIKKSTHNSCGFESDIIVTNIDTFLSSSLRNDRMKSMFLFNNGFVIFDEYHEFSTNAALFSGFINVMMMRTHIVKENTLLLSATPSLIHDLYINNRLDNKLNLILPDEDVHYKSQHSEKYLIRLHKKFPISSMGDNKGNTLFKFNSIRNIQNIYEVLGNDGDILIHSNYTNSDRNRIMNDVFNEFGQNNKSNLDKVNLFGSTIIQSSLDISLKNAYISLSSPDSTIQTIGRINRWGEYKTKDNPEINLFYIGNSDNEYRKMVNSEIGAIRLECELSIVKKWYDFLLDEIYKINKSNECLVDLDTLYKWYNKFILNNHKDIYLYLNKLLKDSNKHLERIYPIKFKVRTKKSKILTANSNKLRVISNKKSIFAIVENTENTKKSTGLTFSEPMQFDIYGDNTVHIEFNEFKYKNSKETLKKCYEVLQSEVGEDSELYDFESLLPTKPKFKRMHLDHFVKMGLKSNTPYVRLDMLYDMNFGLINK